jgi:flagellar motor switch protein FliM
MDPKEILSSEESEALREAGGPDSTPGRNPEGHVVDVHADHWERITTDRVPALESIAERMVSLLKITGRKYFRQAVEITPRPARTERWTNYVRRLGVPTSLNVLEIRPQNMKGVICLDAEFIFVLVDVFFGGNGKSSRPDTHVEFSPMEIRLVRKFVTAIIQDMKDAWKPFTDAEFALGNTEINPIFAGVAAGSDPVSVSTFELAFGDRDFRFDIVLPAPLVESLRNMRDAGRNDGSNSDVKHWSARLKADVQDARVSLRAVLGHTEISLRDLTVAEPGDIIPIEFPATVTLFAGDSPLLEGTFGLSQGHNAVRISKPANRALLGEKYGRLEDT